MVRRNLLLHLDLEQGSLEIKQFKWLKTLNHKVSLLLHLQASLCTSSPNQAPASTVNNNHPLSNSWEVASSGKSASQHRLSKQHLG